jgi:hypothetical protein
MIAFFWFLVANDASFLTAAGRDSEPLPPDVRAVPFLPVPRVFSYQSSQWVLRWIFKIHCRAAGVTHEKEIPEPFRHTESCGREKASQTTYKQKMKNTFAIALVLVSLMATMATPIDSVSVNQQSFVYKLAPACCTSCKCMSNPISF